MLSFCTWSIQILIRSFLEFLWVLLSSFRVVQTRRVQFLFSLISISCQLTPGSLSRRYSYLHSEYVIQTVKILLTVIVLLHKMKILSFPKIPYFMIFELLGNILQILKSCKYIFLVLPILLTFKNTKIYLN